MALTNKGNFIVDGYEWKPKALKVNYESLQGPNTGRADNGVLHIDWVLRRVHKLEITMPPMASNDYYRLLQSVQGKEYSITYFDPLENKEKTIRVYTSNSSAEWYNGVILNGLFNGLTFNAIELGDK